MNKPCSIEKWVFQSRRLKRTKKPRPKRNIPASLRNPQISCGNWKTSNFSKNNQQNLQKLLEYWAILAKLRNGSSNLPDGSVPKGSAQSKTSQLYSQISRLIPATEKYKKPVKKVNEMLLKSRTYS